MNEDSLLSIFNDYKPIDVDYNALVNHSWGTKVIETSKKFWDDLGFTLGMNEQKSEECAIAFDNFAYRLINGELESLNDHYKNDYGYDLERIGFPLIRRIISCTTNFDIDDFINYLWDLDFDLASEIVVDLNHLSDTILPKLDKEDVVVRIISKSLINKFENID